MSGFRFSLEKALELRQTQLEMAEAAFQQQASVLVELDRLRDDLLAARVSAEAQVRNGESVPGCDLMALAAFRLHVKAKEKELAQRRLREEQKLEERRAAMLEASRRCRLMERLKERRKSEWTAARNSELEEMAAESFLAQWNRAQA